MVDNQWNKKKVNKLHFLEFPIQNVCKDTNLTYRIMFRDRILLQLYLEWHYVSNYKSRRKKNSENVNI